MPNPLFHSMFEPTIALIESSLMVVEVNGPLADAVVLVPRGHRVRALRARTGQVWFDFSDLCARPMSPADYAVIADDFPWWVVSGVPTITDMGREPAQRFAHVIDVLYDRELMSNNGLRESMGRVGACGDNAAMESFFALPQKNLLDRRRWSTREELRLAIVTWIEKTYHRKRRQRRLGKLTPIEFETIDQTAHAA